MLLSDVDMVSALDQGQIDIKPYDLERQQPSSYDVTLHRMVRKFRLPEHGEILDPCNQFEDLTYPYYIDDREVFVIAPGELMLACTEEYVRLDSDHAARLEGKSSLGRIGLLVHTTAGFIDPCFAGQITLELVNLSPYPIRLRPHMPIGQLCVISMSSSVERGYDVLGHYQGQTGPTPSRYSWRP